MKRSSVIASRERETFERIRPAEISARIDSIHAPCLKARQYSRGNMTLFHENHDHIPSTPVRRVGGITLFEQSYDGGLVIAPHQHAGEDYLNLVLAGGFEETIGRRRLALYPASVVFHASGEERTNRFVAATRLFNVGIDPTSWAGAPPPGQRASQPLDDAVSRGSMLQLLREFRRSETASSLIIEEVVLEMLHGTALAPPTHSRPGRAPWLGRVDELLRSKLDARPALRELAAVAGVHPIHLHRSFRAHFGCTIGEHVRRLRVDFACRRLAATDDPLVRIALEAGFADQSHFARTFKRLLGATPSDYRASFRPR